MSATEKPYPRTGMWFDPARDGSGISLEVQNGFAFGLIYSYTEEGKSVWYKFTGPLEPVEPEGEGLWTLRSELEVVSGGNCIDCPYQPPEVSGSRGSFSLTVWQRNLISYRIDDGETYRMQPLVWGTPLETVFPQVADHALPMFPDDERVSPWAPAAGLVPWVLVTRTPDAFPDLYMQSSVVYWTASQIASDGKAFSLMFLHEPGDDAMSPFDVMLDCGKPGEPGVHAGIPDNLRERLGPEAVCIVSLPIGPERYRYYVAPLADIGDEYFFATAEDGSSIEGHRLLYR
ncbi:MAG: hypothetical protein M0Q42_13660 [Xanthomonadales bacterium]|nr:hypothetical protein [Xanthomonadales bacterium]